MADFYAARDNTTPPLPWPSIAPPFTSRKLPAGFDAEIYRERNKTKRFFGRLKASFRRIATRYEKTPRNVLSMIK